MKNNNTKSLSSEIMTKVFIEFKRLKALLLSPTDHTLLNNLGKTIILSESVEHDII